MTPDDAATGRLTRAWSVAWAGLRRVERPTLVAALLFATGLVCAFIEIAAEGRVRAQLANDNERIAVSERLLSAMKDLETGERGFVLTGQDEYLEPYRSGGTAIGTELAALSRLGAVMDTLPALVAAKRQIAAQVVSVRERQGDAAARELVRQGEDKASMDRVRTAIAARQMALRRQIDRLNRADDARRWPLLGLAIASMLLGFGGIAWISLRRRRVARGLQAQLTGVLDNAPIGLGFLDGELRVQHMNRALSAMSERGLGAELGVSVWELVPFARGVLEPRLRQVIETGRTIGNLDVATERPSRPGQMQEFQFSFFPLLHGEQDDERGAGMVVTDVTVRKRAERRLREGEERFRTLVDASAAVVWVASAKGYFEQPQPRWTVFTGQSFEQLQGEGWLDAVHPEDRAAALADWNDAVVSAREVRAEQRLRRADGAWRDMEVVAVPVMGDGVVREWVGMHTDITERKLASAELKAAKEAAEAANRAKSQFLANMSHELRTPLSAVIGYSEMIEEEMQELRQTELLGDVQKIKGNARHLLGLINDVLDLSKIEANRMTTYAESFEVAALVQDVAATVGSLAGQKGNELVLDLGEPQALGGMHTDQVKLRQCLINLVSNAAKFTEAGRITVRARREGDMVVFAVADTGIGMTPEQLDRLFERFAQADASTTRKFGGTGLGLAITRSFCRLLGGGIDATSTIGEGSTFTMRIPAMLSQPDEQAAEREVAAEAPARHVVLVVDDDAAQRDLLRRFLERQGFAVRTAADGPTGIAMARTVRPNAILLDVMMPQMDGWSVLTQLKAEPDLAAIPVVMVTFSNEPALSASLGAADLIPKPVDWERLRHVMERFRGTGAVLVVDDDADARARLRVTLQREGWRVAEAENGRTALEQVAREAPALILLDLTMPVMDGFVFLHALRDRPGCAEIPVVVLTARDLSASDRERLGGADRVFSKGETSLRTLAGEVRALAHQPGNPAGSS